MNSQAAGWIGFVIGALAGMGVGINAHFNNASIAPIVGSVILILGILIIKSIFG